MLSKGVKTAILLAVTASLGGCAFLGGEQTEVDFWQPVMSPDQTRVAYVAKGENSYELFVLDLDAAEERQLTSNDRDEVYPSWSPDGAELAYMTAQEKDNWDIFTVDVETGEVFRVTQDPAADVNPSWSPSGEIVFNSNRGDRWGIYAVQPDGSGLRRLSFDRPEPEED
ncbi:MAG: TolB family protein [Candidatus Bipolaricaulaceae bacterium]